MCPNLGNAIKLNKQSKKKRGTHLTKGRKYAANALKKRFLVGKKDGERTTKCLHKKLNLMALPKLGRITAYQTK